MPIQPEQGGFVPEEIHQPALQSKKTEIPFRARERAESGLTSPESEPDTFLVWYVRDFDSPNCVEQGDEFMKEARGFEREYQDELYEKYRADTETPQDERPLQVSSKSVAELTGELDYVYGGRGAYANMPEVVVVQGADKEEANTQHDENALHAIENTQSAVQNFYTRARHGWYDFGLSFEEEMDPIENGELDKEIVGHMLDANFMELHRADTDITHDVAQRYAFSLLFHEGEDEIFNMLQAVRAYIEDGDALHLQDLFTEELLQTAQERAHTFHEQEVFEDYEELCFKDKEYRGGFPTYPSYVAFRQQLAHESEQLDMTELKKTCIERLEEAVDAFRDDYVQEQDESLMDERLLQPVVVSASNDTRFQQQALEEGAQAIPSSLHADDIAKLMTLTASMKASPASLMRERTRRYKRAFYQEQETDYQAERSGVTADTEQELAMITSVLAAETERNGMNPDDVHVLDVACGSGRIAVPLSEQYTITGIDANKDFLAKAKECAEGKNLELLEGDAINYKKTVDAEAYDAVTYTWHSLLEAYGVGNQLSTLTSAWHALKPGGVLVFDQPTRENPGIEDGWYGNKEQDTPDYLAYVMNENELGFMLKMAGFDEVEIKSWKTKPSEQYQDGMNKWTVVARKPTVSENTS